MVTIQRINTTSQTDIERFVDLPYRLYTNHPHWVPPLRENIAMLLNRDEHPYYAQSDANFFVAVRDGRDVGRIALLEHQPFNQLHNWHEAWFYLFECETTDEAAATLLFEHAAIWAKERGLTKLVGPRGFAPIDSMGLLIDGFDYPQPMTMMDYTFADYVAFFEKNGFEKDRDIHSFYIPFHTFQLPIWIHRIADRVQQAGALSIKHFSTMDELLEFAPMLMDTFQRSSAQITGFAPATEGEMEMTMMNILKIGVNPQLIKAILHQETVVGVIFGFPDISTTLQDLQGQFNFEAYQQAILSTSRIILNGFGILPEFRLQGSNALIYSEIEKLAQESNIEAINILHVAETTTQMQQDLAAMGIRPTQTHRLYSKSVG